ncbi:MAG: ThiF family adenylyltransferase [Solirubrobacteraceae bacterium]|nr:ThiF family adenylyltransferase [Solirubrobacteraceae bacterium]
MSRRPISLSPDLKRLDDEGYEIEIREGYLLLHSVPYVDGQARVLRGTLASSLTLAGDVAQRPEDHTVHFTGGAPHDEAGTPINIIASAGQPLTNGLVSQHRLSHKPPAGYRDYYEKMTTYVNILSGPAQALEPAATAVTHGVVVADEDSVFEYTETASSRAGVSVATARLRDRKVAIVGLGGTGAYILDLVAKTPVAEIHLYDGDVLLQHNAFRTPGAASVEDLRRKFSKVEYHHGRYSPMRRQIIAHATYVDCSNVDALAAMDFVFIAVDDGAARRLIVESLEAAGVPFVDVGMGIYSAHDVLGGQVRVTTSTPEQREHIWESDRIPFASADDPANAYRDNIQIADLNMLNAALAVIKWKKLCGFYVDLEGEHHSIYDIDGNFVHNEDIARGGAAPAPPGAPEPLSATEGRSATGEDGDPTTRAAA